MIIKSPKRIVFALFLLLIIIHLLPYLPFLLFLSFSPNFFPTEISVNTVLISLKFMGMVDMYLKFCNLFSTFKYKTLRLVHRRAQNSSNFVPTISH